MNRNRSKPSQPTRCRHCGEVIRHPENWWNNREEWWHVGGRVYCISSNGQVLGPKAEPVEPVVETRAGGY